MTPSPRKRHLRKRRGNSWTPESSARANATRWKLDRERRDEELPDRIRELAAFPPIKPGDVIGSLEYRNHRSGQISRWAVLRGDRVDRVMIRTPDGRTSKSHGWTDILKTLRGVFAGTKSPTPHR